MTQFWFGFITAVAVIAVTIIAAALLSYRRSERKRQAHVDAIMAKVVAGDPSAEFIAQRKLTEAEIAFLEREWERHYTGPKPANPQGKKGVH